MNKTQTTNLDKEKAEPLGDTGDGDTGVPDGEQGISNRAGDKKDDDADTDEFEDDLTNSRTRRTRKPAGCS